MLPGHALGELAHLLERAEVGEEVSQLVRSGLRPDRRERLPRTFLIAPVDENACTLCREGRGQRTAKSIRGSRDQDGLSVEREHLRVRLTGIDRPISRGERRVASEPGSDGAALRRF